MSVTCAAGGWGCFLWEGDTSNKPFEWTGHHQLSAPPPQDSCLPLKGSVRRIVNQPGWHRIVCRPLLSKGMSG
jgi:hypothetical protein